MVSCCGESLLVLTAQYLKQTVLASESKGTESSAQRRALIWLRVFRCISDLDNLLGLISGFNPFWVETCERRPEENRTLFFRSTHAAWVFAVRCRRFKVCDRCVVDILDGLMGAKIGRRTWDKAGVSRSGSQCDQSASIQPGDSGGLVLKILNWLGQNTPRIILNYFYVRLQSLGSAWYIKQRYSKIAFLSPGALCSHTASALQACHEQGVISHFLTRSLQRLGDERRHVWWIAELDLRIGKVIKDYQKRWSSVSIFNKWCIWMYDVSVFWLLPLSSGARQELCKLLHCWPQNCGLKAGAAIGSWMQFGIAALCRFQQDISARRPFVCCWKKPSGNHYIEYIYIYKWYS